MSEKKIVMRSVKGRVANREEAPMIACRGCREVLDDEGDCACSRSRQDAGETWKQRLARTGEATDVPEEIRENWINQILAEYPGTVTREDLRAMRCEALRKWCILAAERMIDRAAKARALEARLDAMPPEVAEPVRRRLNLSALASLPPRVRSAAERFDADARGAAELGPLGDPMVRVSFANLRTESARAEMESGAAQDRREEQQFQDAKADLESPFGAIRQLAAGRIRQLAAGGHKGREELIRSIRAGSSAPQLEGLNLEDVPDHLLRDLAADKPLALGLVKRALQDAARDKKRRR